MCLNTEHIRICAVSFHKGVVSAYLYHFAVLEHCHSVAEACGGKAVRDIYSRAVAYKLIEALIKPEFSQSVQCGGRFVKDYYLTLFIKCSCKGKLLLFAA